MFLKNQKRISIVLAALLIFNVFSIMVPSMAWAEEPIMEVTTEGQSEEPQVQAGPPDKSKCLVDARPVGNVIYKQDFSFVVLIRDINEIPVTGLEDSISIDKGTLIGVVDQQDGKYTITVKPLQVKDSETFKVRINGTDMVELKSVKVNIPDGYVMPNASKTTITPPIEPVFVNQSFNFTVIFRDANNDIISNIPEEDVTLNKGTVENVVKNQEGHYIITARHSEAKSEESFKVRAFGMDIKEFKIKVNAVEGPGIPSKEPLSRIVERPQGDVFQNQNFSFKVEFKDVTETVLDNLNLSAITLNKGTLVSRENLGNGIYQLTAKHSEVKEKESFKVRYNGVDIVELKDLPINVLPEVGVPYAGKSTFTLPTMTIVRNEPFSFDIRILDGFSDPVTGLSNQIALNKGTVLQVTENEGLYTITAKFTDEEEIESIKVRINGKDFKELKDIKVLPAFEVGVPHQYYSSINVVSNEVFVNQEFMMSIELRDGFNTPMTGVVNRISLNKGTLMNVTEGSNGTYTLTLKLPQTKTDESVKIRFDGVDVLEKKPIVVKAPAGVTTFPKKENCTIIPPVGDVVVDKNFTFTIMVRDSNGNAMTGIPANQIVLNKGTLLNVEEKGNGEYLLTAKYNQAVKVSFKTFVYGTDIGELKDVMVKMGEIPVVGELKDGEFEGASYSYGGLLKVKVLIASNEIKDVTVVSHNDTKNRTETINAVKLVPERIVAKKSVQVDVVSGATATSNGIILAVINALAAAKGQPEAPSKTPDTVSGATSGGGGSSGNSVNPVKLGEASKQTVQIKDISILKNGDQEVAKITLADILKALDQKENVKKLELLFSDKANKLSVSIDGESLKELKKQDISIETVFESGSYTIPSKLGALEEISGQGELKGLTLKVEKVDIPSDASVDVKILMQPIKFTLEAEFDQGLIPINYFGKQFIERKLILEGSINQRKSTGVVFENGVWQAVPTIFAIEDGKTVAVIKRNSNSIYSVAEFDKTFKDMEKHWSKDIVTLLASKNIIQGSDGYFMPENSVTRAQFVTMLVKGLGLKAAEKKVISFKDVSTNSWYESHINTAVNFGLTSGYTDNTFKPNKEITREEMVVMVMKAMNLVNASPDMSINTQTVKQEQGLKWKDGEYKGVGSGPNGGTKVGVKVLQGVIQTIDILEIHDSPAVGGAAALQMVDRIIKQQTTDVDVVTGATSSSNNLKEAVIKALEKAAVSQEVNNTETDAIQTNMPSITFSDKTKISSWAKDSVLFALQQNLVSGYEDNTLRPNNTSKRAEAVVVIKNMLEKLNFISY